MIPGVFVPLQAMPVNSHGKLDRGALPVPDLARPAVSSNFVKARTPLEEMVAAIWSQLLGIERVGIYDNFFASGGDSLLAMQIISRLRVILQVDVPVHSFLEAPTVAQLAELVSEDQARGVGAKRPPLRSVSREAYRVPSMWGSRSSNGTWREEGQQVQELKRRKRGNWGVKQ